MTHENFSPTDRTPILRTRLIRYEHRNTGHLALQKSQVGELLALLLDQAEDAVFIVDDLLVVGMDPQVVDAVFRPYERGGRSDRPGHGLGLWVSRLLSAKMGGSLTYARSDGVTRFVLSLPPGP